MSLIDWLVLSITLLFIIFYGVWKSRGTKNIEGYLLADRKLPWYHVGLSVMATQASAITFLSAPGQGYSDGLRFVQFYFVMFGVSAERLMQVEKPVILFMIINVGLRSQTLVLFVGL